MFQYRWEFLLEGGLSLGSAVLQLLPLLVLFSSRESVAGWSMLQAQVLIGWYIMVRAILEGMIVPSLTASIDGVRTGQFDYLLLKPADSMFLCSLAVIRPWKFIDFLLGLAVATLAYLRLNVSLSIADLLIAAILSVTALATCYALFVLAIAASFFLIRIQNLTNVLMAIFDFARWPIQVFSTAWQIVFTVLLPLAIITSYPAMALIGRLTPWMVAVGMMVSAGFLSCARIAWCHAIRGYCSASS